MYDNISLLDFSNLQLFPCFYFTFIRFTVISLLKFFMIFIIYLFIYFTIAPEVLEGKNGHSFEVDVWSTGAIMYTLLIGRPPFESKDVDATYKRILANSFSFPDQPASDDHARSLLRDILQVRL